MTIPRRLLISGTVITFGISAGDMLKLNWTDRQTMPTPVAGVVAGQLGGCLIYAGDHGLLGGLKDAAAAASARCSRRKRRPKHARPRWLRSGGRIGFTRDEFAQALESYD